MSILRRTSTVLTMLVCALGLVAPAPAAAAGGLSMDKARHTAGIYAAEICLADKGRCQSFDVKKCVRSSPKKVACRTVLQLKKDETCSYVLVVTKKNGKVSGRIKNKGNTCF